MNAPESEPKYVISIAARIIGIETHTLRYYERLGIVQPYRSGGNIRYYSERDIEQLRRVKTLVNDLGINIAGVDVIIRMTERIKELQQHIEEMESDLETLRRSGSAAKKGTKRNKGK
jgi:MerR family transcriptional regulator/heat shock protein HspR